MKTITTTLAACITNKEKKQKTKKRERKKNKNDKKCTGNE